MAAIPGVRFNLTGASGSQAALVPKQSWRNYVFPRGAYASQSSTGTLITFDTADIAGRFAALDWIQVGLSTANIRQVNAVGGNSLSVSGSAVTVSEDDRVFLVGNTQPTTSGGSATYLVPRTTILSRDDDSSDRFTNSMVTSNSDGLIAFYATAGLYDCLIQDGNQSNQGYIADLNVGVAEAVSTSFASVFGATVTFNGAIGVTGNARFSGGVSFTSTVDHTGTNTFNGPTHFVRANPADLAIGVTGLAEFNTNVTIGSTLTAHGALGVTGSLTIGASGVLGGLSITTGIFGCSNQPRALVTRTDSDVVGQSFTTSIDTSVIWDSEVFDVGGYFNVAGSSTRLTVPAGHGGVYLIFAQITWEGFVSGNTGFRTTVIRKDGAGNGIGRVNDAPAPDTFTSPTQLISTIDVASAGAFYEVRCQHSQGNTLTVSSTTRSFNQFGMIKLA